MARQREVIQQWADLNEHTIVGWAEDVDVSGSMDPFDTPAFGPWLADRAPEWDIVVGWKLDRFGRDSIKLNKLFGWCIEHGKAVVSTSEGIDLGTPVGRLIANVIAFLAEGELEAIRERQRSSRAKLRQIARWPGGKPPYGYTAVKNDDGWTLQVDEPAATVVRRIVEDVIDGKRLSRIAGELTADGYLTPANYYATVKAGSPTVRAEGDGGVWRTTALRNMLRSKALLGHAHHNGQTIRDDAGMPVQMAEPLVTLDEWELVAATLDKVQQAYSTPHQGAVSPLSGLVFCHFCSGPLHHNHTRVTRDNGRRSYGYRYYGCPQKCGPAITAEELESVVQDMFLEDYGHLDVKVREWVPGDSREADLREAVQAADDLTALLGTVASSTMRQRVLGQLSALDVKIAELESAPSREARWEYRPTGRTYRQEWESVDTVDAHRELLGRSGITIAAGITGVEGKRSKSNNGALLMRINVPADWPHPKPEPIPGETPEGFAERMADLIREDRL